MSTDHAEAVVVLSAHLVAGSPLTVRLVADIVVGADNDGDLYCQGATWDFGDGTLATVTPGCLVWTPDSEFMRHWEETYTYEKLGTYRASFTYGPLPETTVRVEP